ncbi:inorganic polyphosphate kinase [Rufibacter radiotolerans]|uniref:NAD kinase n=1 Tax=Rufibacter radiotolerans TaxID=1379910 RepID=A0A0H4VNH2_9BACT|nr:NAD kinase [Rufibacter radiotolerans]AKQ46858.1 inorganic polyphosphate kinase [Rufibacter radiotolerans]
MKIAIVGKPVKEEVIPFVHQLFEILLRQGIKVTVSEQFAECLDPFLPIPAEVDYFNRETSLHDVSYMLCLGGDGTLLDAVTYVGPLQIPIMGINMGRLGFLASVPYAQLEVAIDSLLKGHFTLDERSLIHLDSDQEVFDGKNFGLNEFSILKRDTSSMIAVHTYIDGEYLNSYWADGLIVATPTGSTGYSLSCGGPVMMPQTNNFVISPVCPHNLNVRPLVVSDRSVISFEIEGRSTKYLVSLDSRSKPVDATIQLAVRREEFNARLIRLNQINFLTTLRTKMHWGLDHRNG